MVSKDYDPNTCLGCGDPIIVYQGKALPLCSKCETKLRKKWAMSKLGDRSARQIKQVFVPA